MIAICRKGQETSPPFATIDLRTAINATHREPFLRV
jgi:hypothetical protein